MNLNTVVIPFTGNKEMCIIPIELHWSRRTQSNGFCRDTWHKMIRRIEKDPNCLVIFAGDMIDDDRPSMRQRKANLYCEPDRKSAMEEADLNHIDCLERHLIPDLRRIKDKIIGMVDGDHFRQYGNGLTSTQHICRSLKIPHAYLGERMGWIRLLFQRTAPCRKNMGEGQFDIFVRHGKGGTGAFGNDINTLIRQNTGFDADLFIGGHTHKSWFVKIPHLFCGRKDIKQRIVGYARAGSLLRGFMHGQSTYAELCEYSPLSIGCPEIFLTVNRHSGIDNGLVRVIDIKGLT